MLKKILKFRIALMLLSGLALYSPGAFAQGHQDGHNGGNFGRQGGGNGHGNRHYYHNGNWNRNGWFGWGVAAPVFSVGVLVSTLPPGYTTVVVHGNTYYYGENTYFSPMSSGGFAVVAVPVQY